MTTDEERREVARKLREEADYPGHAVQYMEQFISDLRQVLFGDLNPTADYSEMFARLADLIEPSCDLIEPSCDRDALLELADDIDKQTDGSMFDIWLEDGHYIARRIREACREVEG